MTTIIKISRTAFQELVGALRGADLIGNEVALLLTEEGQQTLDIGDWKIQPAPLPETPSQPADKHVPPTEDLAREHYVAHKQDEIAEEYDESQSHRYR